MEETKETVKKSVDNSNEKLSYEQLENVAHQLHQQNRNLLAKLRETEAYAFQKRVDYLFKVLKYKESFDLSFVEDCVNEITETLKFEEDIKETKDEQGQ